MWAENDFPPPGQLLLASLDVPGDDKVYTMYHGISKEVAAIIMRTGIRQSRDGLLGQGVYLSRNVHEASIYPVGLPVLEKAVLRVRVNVGKVIAIQQQGHPLQRSWHDHGYDTAWCPPKCGMVPSGLEEDCVWDPNRIVIIGVIYSKVC